jgi:hypothetical protein
MDEVKRRALFGTQRPASFELRDLVRRCCEEAEQAGLAVEAAIKLDVHRQPRKQPRASRESEYQLQAFRKSW